jgi:hypothetical protein
MTNGRLLCGCAALALAASACHDYETQVTVRDPSRVALAAVTTEDGKARPVLPAGSEPASVVYGGGVTAERGARGTLRLACGMCELGTVTLVDDSGRFAASDSAAGDAFAPAARAQPELHFRPGDYVTSTAAYGNAVQTSYVTPELSTPWDNVKEAKEKRTPSRFAGWTTFFIPGVILTGAGALLLTAGVGGVGAGFLVVGLGLDVGWIYHAFFPSVETVVYPVK